MLHWDAENLWLALEPHAPGLSIEVLPETRSTNTALLERARAGDTAPCLLVAERQSAGRGRLGRSWQSWAAAPGRSLTFSLACPLAPADWSGLSLAVGLALAEALHPRIGIKWPNDLWLRGDDRKLGGILIETLMAPGAAHGARQLVVGVGLNIEPLGADEPAAAATFGSGYACLQELDPAASAPLALHRVALPLWQALQDFERHGLTPLLSRFAQRDVLVERAVQAGDRQGVACGVAADGALRLRDAAGRIHTVHSGEVSARPC
jgi:BirA family transcriptional regulator, biotin operon repressor / biotin---[acetyl-CoA-carboxylase] ligase